MFKTLTGLATLGSAENFFHDLVKEGWTTGQIAEHFDMPME